MESRNKKKLKLDHCNNVEDRISDLPDDCLLHILSFVDVRTAVQSSILAKRWRYLRNSLRLCSVHFTNPPCMNEKKRQRSDIVSADVSRQCTSFMNSVDKVLLKLRRHDKIKLQTFQLDSYYECEPDRITAWIRELRKHSVKYLRLSFTKPSYAEASMLDTQPILLSSFRHLQVLHFEGLIIKHQGLIAEALTNCTLLETLVVIRCKFRKTNKLRISSQHLKKLVLIDLSLFWSYHSLVTKICAPNLTSLTMFGTLKMQSYSLKTLTSLVNADIRIKGFGQTIFPEYYAGQMMKLFSRLRHVRDLTIQVDACLFPSSGHEEASIEKPMLLHLRCLELKVSSYGDSIPALTDLLEASKCVKTLVLERLQKKGKGKNSSPDVSVNSYELEWGTLGKVRTIEMKNFGATNDELEVLKALLTKAVVLEKVILSVSVRSICSVYEMLKEEIPKFRHSSSSILFLFVNPRTSVEYKKYAKFQLFESDANM